ncbi:hypothetical protein OROMI_001040 [Orobanche minor]
MADEKALTSSEGSSVAFVGTASAASDSHKRKLDDLELNNEPELPANSELNSNADALNNGTQEDENGGADESEAKPPRFEINGDNVSESDGLVERFLLYRPEGCIAECYIAEEAVEFLAELFYDERTVGMPSAPITLDRRTSGATVVSVYGKLYDQAHLCVLQNTNEFRDYFNEHWELLKLEFPRYAKDEKWLTDKQNKTFADWVKARVATQLSEPGHKIPEIVRWLSDKPSNEVPKFVGYKIRGTQYTTKERDDMRSTQNSGVYLVAEMPQVASARDKRMVREDMSFYGVIIEIWELNYEKFRFPIFKCDWVDNEKGAVVVDELGFPIFIYMSLVSLLS